MSQPKSADTASSTVSSADGNSSSESEQQLVSPGQKLLEQREEAEYQRDLGSAKDFRYLFPSLRQYRAPSIWSIVFICLEAFVELCIPMLTARLIDDGITRKNMNAVLYWGGILAALSLVALVFGSLAGIFSAKASAGFARNLRHDLFHKVQGFSFTNIDHFSTGSIITRLTTDVTNVQFAYQLAIIIAFRAPVLMVVAWILSFQLSHSISLMFLLIFPAMGVIILLIAAQVHPIFIRVFHTYDRLNSNVDEDLNGMRVVKSFNRESYQQRRFERISQRIYDLFAKAEYRLATLNPIVNFFMFAAMIALSWMAANQIVASGNNPERGLTTGDLASLMTYLVTMLSAVLMMLDVFIMVIISRASASRMAAVLREKNTMRVADHPLEDVPDGSVEFDHASFRYDATGTGDAVIDDVSLSIPSGSTVGIIGGTGSAKTSLVQLIPRLYDVQRGSVKVGGHDVRDYDLKALRTAVSMVLQKNTLFAGTVAENLRWGNPDATDEEVLRASKLAQADEFVQQMPDKYETRIDQGGANVSGGQKQRLCIARALLRRPKVLILDDSTSAVDTKTDALIRKALATEIPDTTKIIIAQRLSSVQDADQIFMMDNGRVVAHGTHEELLASNEEYRAIYDSQNQNKREARRVKEKVEGNTQKGGQDD
jgi:ATP-binding cassette subfamily B multidrug efflux pump